MNGLEISGDGLGERWPMRIQSGTSDPLRIPKSQPGREGKTMSGSNPKRIKVVIYLNQLEWMDKIGRIMHRTRRQVFLECFSEYIGGFKADTGYRNLENSNEYR